MVGLVLAVMNWAKFVLTEKQMNGKCKFLHPMVSFYSWIVLDFISNIIWLVFAVEAGEFVMPMVVFLPATFKIIIGVEQIWLMIELVVQINRATRILSSSETEMDDSLVNSEDFEFND